MIVFIHIPKTGGTSVRESARQYFGDGRMLYDYAPAAPKTSPLVREWVYQRADLKGFAEQVQASGFQFMSGHFSYNKYARHFRGAQFVSWVREPVARLWSSWCHAHRHQGFEGDFKTYYQRPEFQNQQSDYVGTDLSCFAMLGVLEHFDQSLEKLNRDMGLGLRPLHENSAPDALTAGPDQQDREQIKALNKRDQALYEAAIKRLAL